VAHNCARVGSFNIVVTTLPDPWHEVSASAISRIANWTAAESQVDTPVTGEGDLALGVASATYALAVPPAVLRSRCILHPHKEPRFIRRDDRVDKDVVLLPGRRGHGVG
jgi:hypothetical protein